MLLTSLSFAVSGGVFAGSAGESSIETLQAAQRAEMAESSGRGHEDLDRMLIQGWREANALASQSLQ